MRRSRVYNWLILWGGLAILSLTGCNMSLQEAMETGIFDFVACTITDTLSQLLPMADIVANAVG